MRPLDDVVLGVGLRGHLGLSALPFAAAVRARLLEPRDTPYLDAHGRPAALASAASLGGELHGLERYVALGGPALREAASKLTTPTALLLVLPDVERPDVAGLQLDALLAGLEQASGVTLDRSRSRICARGHAGGAKALREAFEHAAKTGADVLVGAIDSAWHPETPSWLDARGWLCTEEHDAGRTPSEAAVFLHVGQRPRKRGAARITAVEYEPADGPDERRDAGRRLGRLARRAASASAHGPLQWVVPDLNGELERQRCWTDFVEEARAELGAAMLDELVPHIGDVGAATSLLLLGLCVSFAHMGAVPVQNGLVVSQSDDGSVGVIALDLPAPQSFLVCVGSAHAHALAARPGSRRPSIGELGQMERVARSCLEDLGSMGLLLAPEPLDGEGDPAEFGQRLLDAFDAFVALGLGGRGVPRHPDLLAVLDRYVAEVDPPDRGRRFAGAFVRSHLVAPTKPPRGR